VAEQPPIQAAIAAVMREVTAIGKDRTNVQQSFKFRGVDDVMNALAEPFRKHGVFVLPEVREIHTEVRQGTNRPMNAVRLRMAFHFHGPAGDVVTAVTQGEGIDVADKATNKAMAAAFKYALLYAFMIPTEGTLDEGDAEHQPGAPEAPQKPQGGFTASIADWVALVEQAPNLVELRRLWTGIAASGSLNQPYAEGSPDTLKQLLEAKALALDIQDGEPNAGA
jgi:ERF superfamily